LLHLFLVSLSVFVVACSNGGSGGDDPSPVEPALYSGATSSAQLNLETARDFVSFLFIGTAYAQYPDPLDSTATPRVRRARRASATARVELTRLNALSRGAAGRPSTTVREAVESDGGTKSVSGQLSGNGTGSITVVYDRYVDSDGFTLNGTIVFEIRGYDALHDALVSATATFMNFSSAKDDYDETVNGTLQISESYEDQLVTLNANLDGRDNISSSVYRFENFVTETRLLAGGSVLEETYAGRVYLGRYGFVDVETTDAWVYGSGYFDELAYGGGPLVLAGNSASAARVTPTGNAKVQIEVDADGDEAFETSAVYFWNDLYGNPTEPDPQPAKLPDPPTDPIVYSGSATLAKITDSNARRFFNLIWNPPFDLTAVADSIDSAIDTISGATSGTAPIPVSTVFPSYGGGSLSVTGTKTGYDVYEVVATFDNYGSVAGYILDGTVQVKSTSNEDRQFDVHVLTFATPTTSHSISGTASSSLAYGATIVRTRSSDLTGRNNLTGSQFKLANVVNEVTSSSPNPKGGVSGRLYLGDAGYVDLVTPSLYDAAFYLDPYPIAGGAVEIHGAEQSTAVLIPLSMDRARVNVDADGNSIYETGAPYFWTNLEGSASPNQPPVIGVLTIAPLPTHSSDTLTANLSSASDPDGDSLTVSYEWTRNGVVISGEIGASLSNSRFAKGDTIVAKARVSDGAATATATSSPTTILGPLPVVTANPPQEAAPGVEVTFKVDATISDGSPITLSLLYGPTGMKIGPDGTVTWTPREPMFGPDLDVNFGIRATAGADHTDYENTIVVHDPARARPFVRTDLRSPYSDNGLRLADFDGSGRSDIVVSDQYKVLGIWTYDALTKGYYQSWVYPFDLAPNASIGDITTADVNGDAKPDIVVCAGSRIVLIDGVTHEQIGALSDGLKFHASPRVADLDGDGKKELVFIADTEAYSSDGNTVFAYDLGTLKKKWESAAALHGNLLEVGNVDADSAVEIITSNGYVLDGVSRQVEWNLGSQFGIAIALGDFDGDGIQEIVGRNPNYTNLVRAYSAALKSPVWETPASAYSINAMAIGNVDGDAADELLIDNGSGLSAYSYSSAAGGPVKDWTITYDTYFGSDATLALGDPDGDGAKEIVRLATGYSEQVAVISVGANGGIEWSNTVPNTSGNSSPLYVMGPFYGGHAISIPNDGTYAVFIARDGYNSYNHRLVRMDVSTGKYAYSPVIVDTYSYGTNDVSDAFDYDGDGVDEIFVKMTGYDTTTGTFTRIVGLDPKSGTAKWNSPNLSFDTGLAGLAHANLNGDAHAELVMLSSDAYIYVFDVYAGKLLWKSTRLPENCGADVAVGDLDGDGALEIAALPCRNYIVTSRKLWIYKPDATYGYVLRGSVDVPVDGFLAVGDANNDAAPDIIVSEVQSSSSVPDRIRAYDGVSLVELLSYALSGKVSGLRVLPDAGGRARLLVAQSVLNPSGNYPYYSDSTELTLIDAENGNEIWRSPMLLGIARGHDLSVTDVNGDELPELIFGTTQAMYLTR
jgi:hypothetical protein